MARAGPKTSKARPNRDRFRKERGGRDIPDRPIFFGYVSIVWTKMADDGND